MEKSYIEKITAFISNMRIGNEDESQPTSSLIAFKNEDKFIDFHFNTDYTPQISDFEYIEIMPGLFGSIINAFLWYERGDESDIDYEGFVVQYIPKGTEMEGGYTVKNDVLMITSVDGCGVYYNAGAVEYMYDVDHEEITEGWQVDSFRDWCEKYEENYDLGEDSFGIMVDELDGLSANYSQPSNGKVYGFKPEDIKGE